MNGASIAAIIMSVVMVLGMLGTLVAMVFRLGTMNGRLASFMEVSQRDRQEMRTNILRIEEAIDRHIESHRDD